MKPCPKSKKLRKEYHGEDATVKLWLQRLLGRISLNRLDLVTPHGTENPDKMQHLRASWQGLSLASKNARYERML